MYYDSTSVLDMTSTNNKSISKHLLINSTLTYNILILY